MNKLSQGIDRLLYPQRNTCHLCRRALTVGDAFLCPHCQAQLDAEALDARECMSARHAPLTLCVSAYSYAAQARILVQRFKYQGDATVSRVLSPGMCAALAQSALARERWDALVPVPLHVTRLDERGYNQALLLAADIGAQLGIPVLADALARVKPTIAQATRTRAERLHAMRDAFAASPAVQQKSLLLIDDVLTTGATAVACTQSLLSAGATRVALLTACCA